MHARKLEREMDFNCFVISGMDLPWQTIPAISFEFFPKRLFKERWLEIGSVPFRIRPNLNLAEGF